MIDLTELTLPKRVSRKLALPWAFKVAGISAIIYIVGEALQRYLF